MENISLKKTEKKAKTEKKESFRKISLNFPSCQCGRRTTVWWGEGEGITNVKENNQQLYKLQSIRFVENHKPRRTFVLYAFFLSFRNATEMTLLMEMFIFSLNKCISCLPIFLLHPLVLNRFQFQSHQLPLCVKSSPIYFNTCRFPPELPLSLPQVQEKPHIHNKKTINKYRLVISYASVISAISINYLTSFCGREALNKDIANTIYVCEYVWYLQIARPSRAYHFKFD